MSKHRSLVPNDVPRPTVVLWDLDNVDPGPNAARSVGRALGAMAGPGTYKLASGHPRLMAAREELLLGLGWVLLPARPKRNAADAQLLNAAGWLRRHAGMREFIVASGDGAFARLAARTSVTVAAMRPAMVSRQLAALARSVVALDENRPLARNLSHPR